MRVVRFLLFCLIGLAVIAAGGFLWLRNSPAWPGITLFSEAHRVENFQRLDRVFPAEPVLRDGATWDLPQSQTSDLPETYDFEGETRDLAAFLDQSETMALLVLHQGAIRHEEYRMGSDAATPFTSWSVAKSILSALIGIALEEGHIADLGDPIDSYVPELAGTAYGAVTIEQALTMSSGIAFDEDYDSFGSDINGLFIGFATGSTLAGSLAGFDSDRPAGSYNNYISSDSIALGLVLEGATGETLTDYMTTRLWGPLGAEADGFWNVNRAGEAIPMCCFNGTLRDYGRFGQLYLQQGARDGVQIVPGDWVTASTAPSAPHLEPGDNPASFWTFGYGYHWWIPENPQGDYLAIGIWGQFIYIHPTLEVVIVKTSADPGFDTRDHETVAAFRAIAAHVAQQN